MFATVRSTTLLGVVGRAVDVEVHIGVGLIADVALRLGRLEAQGWAVVNGGWWEALLAS